MFHTRHASLEDIFFLSNWGITWQWLTMKGKQQLRKKKIESVRALEKHLRQDFEVCCFGG